MFFIIINKNYSMNFDESEKLRDELKIDQYFLKTIKTKKGQALYSEFVKKHNHTVNKLILELEKLKEDFNIFKIHTMSQMKNKELNPRQIKCVTSPFDIYIQYK